MTTPSRRSFRRTRGLPTSGIGPYAPIVSYPNGLIHLWKMAETSGNRLNSLSATYPMVQTAGAPVTAGTGKRGNSAIISTGGAYLKADSLPIPDRFTLAVWAKGIAGGSYPLGPNGDPTIHLNSPAGRMAADIQDHGTGDDTYILIDTGSSITGSWVLIVWRFNNVAPLSMNARIYGFASNNATTYNGVQGSGPWVNPLPYLSIWPGYYNSSENTEVDEIQVYNRLLSDAECDSLNF